MNNPKKHISPESLFEEAMEDAGPDMKAEELRLLVSGVRALKERGEKRLSKNERFAITSLISYAAYKQKVSTETVTSVLQAEFGIEEMQDFPSHFYNEAINFLVDLEMNKTIN